MISDQWVQRKRSNNLKKLQVIGHDSIKISGSRMILNKSGKGSTLILTK